MTNLIYDKTDKGREEIATRKYHLSPRLRTLLVLIDGKHSVDDLLKKVAGIGLNDESVTELLNQGFIQFLPEQQTSSPKPASPSVQQPPLATPPAEPLPLDSSILSEGESQYEAIYHFYTETIKSTIGLRGYALQLKVERAASIEDFRALRIPYLEAVMKTKGQEMARSLRNRLDQLLYLGNKDQAPSTTIIGADTASSE